MNEKGFDDREVDDNYEVVIIWILNGWTLIFAAIIFQSEIHNFMKPLENPLREICVHVKCFCLLTII